MATYDPLRKQLVARGDLVARAVAADLKEQLQRSAQDHHHSTTPAKGVVVTVRRDGANRWQVVATARGKIATFTDKGTRPHMIRPRRAKALAWSKGGKTIFAAWVWHPGYKGSGWFRKVMIASNLRETVRRNLRR